jgi:outer membrane protein OmpA-like peptidoglycan-associated protein
MRKDTLATKTESQQELEKLRAVILGQNHHLITDAVNKQAREIVGNVFTEALHARQKQDGSVNKILLPIIENSIENSVSNHSERLTSSLYPLMGSLIRKSVSAFLSDFVERTNQLIENSFTLKGLKWRLKAWQAGVSFTQYVVSQTYNYRVEHVLLIHQKTGLLLKAVNLDQQSKSDVDLISSMLTAINDFVGDSFEISKDGLKEQLQTVSTDNFNLLIKPGPSAIIVAAVTGNPPQQVANKLQVTLENIHSLYIDEFKQFNGDNKPFENAEIQLRDCLLEEEKNSELNINKKPWFSWLLLTFVTVLLGFKVHSWYQLEQINQRIMAIDQQPGIVVQKITINSKSDIALDVMRDPDAIGIEKWFITHKIPFETIMLKERMYHSLSPKVIAKRVEKIMSSNSNISHLWDGERLLLKGKIDSSQYKKLIANLTDAGITSTQLDLKNLSLINSNELAQSLAINKQVFVDLLGKISSIQLGFDSGSNQVTSTMQVDLQLLADQFSYLKKLARQLNISVGLVIMGSSDNSGIRSINNKLSVQRAESTAKALTQLGLNRAQMFVTGLGQIDLKDVKHTSRKVMFNVIYVNQVAKDKLPI